MTDSDFSPGLAGTMKGYRLLLLLSGALMLAGFGWIAFSWNSMSATDWGVFAAVWMFLTGITQFGVVFSATMRICEAEWARPYHRIAEIVTLSFAPIAFLGFLLIYFGGLDDLLFWTHAGEGAHLSPWLNETFLFWRNLLAMLLFPSIFHDKISDKIRQITGEYLSSELQFENTEVSFFRHFPSLTLTMEGVEINGSGPFSRERFLA